MAGLLEQMDVNPEDFNNIKEQTVGGSVLDSGVYPMIINTAFIRKTGTGAKMLELEFQTEDGQGRNHPADHRWREAGQATL